MTRFNPYTLAGAIRDAVDEGRADEQHAMDFYIEFLDYLSQEYPGFDVDRSQLPVNEALILFFLVAAAVHRGDIVNTRSAGHDDRINEPIENWLRAAAICFALPYWPWFTPSLEQTWEAAFQTKYLPVRGARAFEKSFTGFIIQSSTPPSREVAKLRSPGHWQRGDSWENVEWSYLWAHSKIPLDRLFHWVLVSTRIARVTSRSPKYQGVRYQVAEGPGREPGTTGWYFSTAANPVDRRPGDPVWGETDVDLQDEGPYTTEAGAEAGAKQYIGEGTTAPEPVAIEPGLVFSHRSMRPEDNLPTLLEYLEEVNPDGFVALDIPQVEDWQEGGDLPLFPSEGHPWWQTEEPYEMMSEAVDAINEAPGAPPLHWFGTGEWDLTDFGWWLSEEGAYDAIRDLAEDDWNAYISRGDEALNNYGRGQEILENLHHFLGENRETLSVTEIEQFYAIDALGAEGLADVYNAHWELLSDE